jgi:uncharacterized protein (TIGR00255 family)
MRRIIHKDGRPSGRPCEIRSVRHMSVRPWSMTGYGEGAGGRIHCAMRSVNSRFLEVRLRLPEPLRPLEAKLEAAIRQELPRGKVEATFTLVTAAAGPDPARLRPRLEGWLATGLVQAPVSLSDLLRLAAENETAAPDESLADEAENALTAALAGLRESQRHEGNALVVAVCRLLDAIRADLDGIESLAAAAPVQLRAALADRLGKLESSAPVDPQRLAQEVALLADRCDITEEIVRLKAHLAAVDTLLKGAEIGKKLDFFTQEMGREVNTIGSKSRAVEIAHAVIEMKAKLEKIKEQAANLG